MKKIYILFLPDSVYNLSKYSGEMKLCLHCKKGLEPQINDVNWVFWSAELPRRRVPLSATLLPTQVKTNAECRFLYIRWSITWTSGCLYLLSLNIFEHHITLFAPLVARVSFSVFKSQPKLCPNFQIGPVHHVCSEHAYCTEDTTPKYKCN